MWQYCKDEPDINNANGDIIGFNVVNTITSSFKRKQKNKQNRQQWQKSCLYDSAIKISN